jgi:hypothetical protein
MDGCRVKKNKPYELDTKSEDYRTYLQEINSILPINTEEKAEKYRQILKRFGMM